MPSSCFLTHPSSRTLPPYSDRWWLVPHYTSFCQLLSRLKQCHVYEQEVMSPWEIPASTEGCSTPFHQHRLRQVPYFSVSCSAESSPSLLLPKHSVACIPNSPKVPMWRLWQSALLLTWKRTSHNDKPHPIGNELPWKPGPVQAWIFCAKRKTSALSLTLPTVHKQWHMDLKQNFCQNKVLHCTCNFHLGEGTGQKACHSCYSCHDVWWVAGKPMTTKRLFQ